MQSQFNSGSSVEEDIMINIGVDSYVSVAEADAYVQNYYNEFENLRVIWEVLPVGSKETYLKQSAFEIDEQLMVGIIFDKAQEMQFPRKECYKEGPQVPSEVKDAQIENALAIMKESVSARSDEQMKILNSLGAMKNLKYNKREMGEVGLGASLTGQAQLNYKRLTSEEAEKMLKAWLG